MVSDLPFNLNLTQVTCHLIFQRWVLEWRAEFLKKDHLLSFCSWPGGETEYCCLIKRNRKKSIKKLEVVNNVMWERKVKENKTSEKCLGFIRVLVLNFFPVWVEVVSTEYQAILGTPIECLRIQLNYDFTCLEMVWDPPGSVQSHSTPLSTLWCQPQAQFIISASDWLAIGQRFQRPLLRFD